MFFALNTFLWNSRFEAGMIAQFEHMKSLGADTIEIQRSGFEAFPVDAIRRELERLDLGCTLCTSPPDPGQCVIAEDADDRRAGLAYLRTAIAVVRDLGGRLICGPLYAPPWWFTGNRATDQQRDWAIDAFARLDEDLKKAGIALAIEPLNRFETFFLNTCGDGVALCEKIGSQSVGLLLDSAHMVIEEKDPVLAIRHAGEWLKHLHLPESDRGTPGSGGLLDWPGIFNALRVLKYKGGCAIESFPFTDAGHALKTRTWRDLAPSIDVLARDGLTFLKQCHVASGKPRPAAA